MNYYLRKIRLPRWERPKNSSWLLATELPADPLADLATSKNSLSVWLVDNDRSNLERVIAAIAASSDHVSQIDYALATHDAIIMAGFKLVKSDGGTPDEEANSRWHCDVVELSSARLVDLALCFDRCPMPEPKGRIREARVATLIGEGLRNERLRTNRLREEMKESLRKHSQ